MMKYDVELAGWLMYHIPRLQNSIDKRWANNKKNNNQVRRFKKLKAKYDRWLARCRKFGHVTPSAMLQYLEKQK